MVRMSLREVARRLGGDVIGAHQVVAPGPGHSRKDRSLTIAIREHAPEGFLVHSHAGDDFRTCRQLVREKCGLSGWEPRRVLPRAGHRRVAACPFTPPTQDCGKHPPPGHDEEEARRKLATARALWDASVPLQGTPAETYLRAARRITCVSPSTLRFLPARGNHPPALIAAFGIPCEPEPGILLLPPRHITGVHLTRLQPDGSSKVHNTSKIMLGRSSGSPIVLAPMTDLCGLGIAEELENALSHHIATGLGVWAAGCASRLPSLAAVVPPYVETVSIVVDDDDAGRRYSHALKGALLARGFEVRRVTARRGDRQ